MIDYRKYTFNVKWSEKDRAFMGTCLEFKSLSSIAKSPEKAIEEIQCVVKETIERMENEGVLVPEPLSTKEFKGKLTLRVTPELHRSMAIEAGRRGETVNKYIINKLKG